MPLPRVDGTCEIPTEVCCPSLFDFAVALLDFVMADLNACLPEGPCSGELTGYATVGTFIQDPICDTLIVSLTGISPQSGSPTRLTPIVSNRADYLIQLHESGFPVLGVSGDVVYAPPPEFVHAIAKHSYSHGERMYRSVLNALTGPDRIAGCGFVNANYFRPIGPSGGCVGWEMSVTANVTLGPISSV